MIATLEQPQPAELRNLDAIVASLDGVNMNYGNIRALRGVDFQVRTGEVVALLGPNGAGKTTTLRMLATLLPPSGGTAMVAGCDLLKQPGQVRERIGYVGQAGGSDREIMGRTELVFQGRLYGMSLAAAASRAADLIEMLELEACADRKVATYSGGQKRRLDIGLGLVHDPQLLFLDEPTTGLDPQSRARVWDEVRRMHDRGTTVFLTTHYLDEADALCDRIAIIDHGQIVAIDTPEALKASIGKDRVQIQTADDQAAIAALAGTFGLDAAVHEGAVTFSVASGEQFVPRLFTELGIPIRSVSVSRPSLDDVFMSYTGKTIRDAEASGTDAMRQMAARFRGRR